MVSSGTTEGNNRKTLAYYSEAESQLQLGMRQLESFSLCQYHAQILHGNSEPDLVSCVQRVSPMGCRLRDSKFMVYEGAGSYFCLRTRWVLSGLRSEEYWNAIVLPDALYIHSAVSLCALILQDGRQWSRQKFNLRNGLL